METEKIFEGGDIVILIFGNESYRDKSVSITSELSDSRVCYVTLNKTYESMRDELKKNHAKMRNISFIDGITKTIGLAPEDVKPSDCRFISSPGALTEISIAVGKALESHVDYIILDSLSNVSIYQDKDTVSRFVSSIANKARTSKVRAIFYLIDSEQSQVIVKECGMMVDKVVHW